VSRDVINNHYAGGTGLTGTRMMADMAMKWRISAD